MNKRDFFKRLIGAVVVAVAPVVMEFPITSPIPLFDIRSSLIAQMSKQIQDEIDRDMITRLHALIQHNY